jgi:hypothetical protein
MRPFMVPGIVRKLSFLFLALTAVSVSAQQDVTTTAESEVPEWAKPRGMQLSLSTNPGLQFAVIPLTPNLGLNDTTGVVIDVRHLPRPT